MVKWCNGVMVKWCNGEMVTLRLMVKWLWLKVSLTSNSEAVYANESSMMSVRTSVILSPAARTCCGIKLVEVIPGVVLISITLGTPFSIM